MKVYIIILLYAMFTQLVGPAPSQELIGHKPPLPPQFLHLCYRYVVFIQMMYLWPYFNIVCVVMFVS